MKHFQTRTRWICLLMMALCACDSRSETQSFDSARPLADAAQTLNRKYGYLISYEDPRRACACDLVDELGRQMKAGDRIPLTGRIVPRTRKLRVEFDEDVGAAAVARAIVSAAKKQLPEYQFRVLESGEWAYIVPLGERDAAGTFTTHPTPLDVHISLPAEPRTSWELINAICEAVSNAAGVRVNNAAMLWGIESSAGPPRYTVGANDEVARDVLRRALDTVFLNNDDQMIWLMFYDSPEDQYFLNLAPVPRAANKKGG